MGGRDRPPQVASIKKITERNGKKEKPELSSWELITGWALSPAGSDPSLNLNLNPAPGPGYFRLLWKHWVCSFTPQKVWWRAASRRSRQWSDLSSDFFFIGARVFYEEFRTSPFIAVVSALSPSCQSHTPIASSTTATRISQLAPVSLSCFLLGHVSFS